MADGGDCIDTQRAFVFVSGLEKTIVVSKRFIGDTETGDFALGDASDLVFTRLIGFKIRVIAEDVLTTGGNFLTNNGDRDFNDVERTSTVTKNIF